MLSIEEAVQVENPAEALRGQDGLFEVVSPYGHTFRVVCSPNTKMSVRQIGEPPRPVAIPAAIWKIRRVFSHFSRRSE